MHTVAEAANALALMSVTVKVAMRVKAIKIFLIIVIYPDLSGATSRFIILDYDSVIIIRNHMFIHF